MNIVPLLHFPRPCGRQSPSSANHRPPASSVIALLIALLFATTGPAQTSVWIADGTGGIGTNTTNTNVGIGTNTPSAKLTVSGSGYPFWMLEDTGNQTFVAGRSDGYVFFNSGGNYTISSQAYTSRGTATGDTARLTILGSNGNVGIGTTNPSHKLAVNGTVRAKEVIVDTGWADYVFTDDYRLTPLSEVEAHIRANKHLPGIPSAAEVATGGVSLGDMQAKLLAKVEELTLHMIRLEKENAVLRQRVQALEDGR